MKKQFFLFLYTLSIGLCTHNSLTMQAPESAATKQLIKALDQKDVKAAEQAITQGADVNALIGYEERVGIGWYDMPLINAAASMGDFDMIRLLYAHGADINSQSPKGKIGNKSRPGTVFLAYASSGFAQLRGFDWLLSHGAWLPRSENGNRSLIVERQLNRIERLRWLFEHGFRLTAQELDQYVGVVHQVYAHSPLLQAIVLRENIENMLEKIDTQAEGLSPEQVKEVEEAFILAAAQNSSVLYDILHTEKVSGYITAPILAQAFVRAALNGDIYNLKNIIQARNGALKHYLKTQSAATIADFRNRSFHDALRYAYAQGYNTTIVDYLRELNNELNLGVNFTAIQSETRPHPENTDRLLKGIERGKQIKQKIEKGRKEKEKEREKEHEEGEEAEEKEKETSSQEELEKQFKLAVKNRDINLLKRVLSQGVDPNTLVDDDPAILSLATHDNIDMIKLLIEHGADINALDRTRLWRNSWLWYGNVVFFYLVTYNECKTDITDFSFLEWLDEHGAHFNVMHYHGNSVLVAISHRNSNAIRWLLEHGVRYTRAMFETMSERLYKQVRNAYPDQSLLQYIVLFQPNNPLFDYTKNNGTITKLLDELGMRIKNNRPQPTDIPTLNQALLLAVAQENTSITQMILKTSVLADHITPNTLQQALRVAASIGNTAAAIAIINHAQAEITAGQDNWYQAGLEALNRAIAHGHGSIIEQLLKALPTTIVTSELENLRTAIATSSQLSQEERRNYLVHFDEMLETAHQTTSSHIDPSLATTARTLMETIPSGALATMISFLFSSLQYSQAYH